MKHIIAISGLIGTTAFSQNIEKPNIIVILMDDLGWGQVSCNGNPFYTTPHIDRLAREGVRFTNAYSSCAVSSPTRAALLTGKCPARMHLTNFIPGHNIKGILQEPAWQKYLSLEEKTLAEIAREKGYVTGLFGKWHLAPAYTGDSANLFGPDKQGFQETEIFHKPSTEDRGKKDPHHTIAITSKGCDFIRKNADKNFFLILSHNAVHAPIMEDTALIQKYKNKKEASSKENNPVIAAMMETADKQIGVIMNTLEETRLINKTIVIFLSDNGGLLNHAAQTPLRAGKGFYYEGGIRVPLIVWYPEKIKPAVCDYPVISTDIFYTLSSIMGEEKFAVKDGMDISTILFKHEIPSQERTLFWHYPHYHATGMKPGGAMRKGNYKLIVWYEKMLNNEKCYELYDLSKDLSEEKDLSSQMPAVAEKMFEEYKQWLKETNAQMPIKK